MQTPAVRSLRPQGAQKQTTPATGTIFEIPENIMFSGISFIFNALRALGLRRLPISVEISFFAIRSMSFVLFFPFLLFPFKLPLFFGLALFPADPFPLRFQFLALCRQRLL